MKGIWGRLRENKLFLVSLIGTTIIPLIYGGLYLWAFWDPYTGMRNAKVAVVNLDAGSVKDDQAYNFGKDIIDKLKDDHNLDWQFVDQNKADQGIKNLAYYATLTIPADFSSKLLSVDGDSPTTASFNLKIRDTNSYFASKFIKSAVNELARKLRSEVGKKYFDNLFVNIRKIGDGLRDGSEGAYKLDDGLKEAKDGSQSLFDGIVKFKDGLLSLKDGIGDLFGGSQTLRDNVDKAYGGSQTLMSGISSVSSGIHNIATNSAALSLGSVQIASGVASLSKNSDLLLSGAVQINDGLSAVSSEYLALSGGISQTQNALSQISQSLGQVNSNLSSLASDYSASPPAKLTETITMLSSITDSVNQLSGRVTSLTAASIKIQNGIGQLSTNNSAFVAKLGQFDSSLNKLSDNLIVLSASNQSLAQGVARLDNGMMVIESGMVSLNTGLHDLSTGSATLADKLNEAKSGGDDLYAGIGTIQDGSKTLTDGLSSAQNGSQKLAGKLSDSAMDISNRSAEENVLKKTGVMADPLTVNEEHIGIVANNGTAFAPYFIPLSLWVGAMSIFFVLKMPTKRRFSSAILWLRSQKTYMAALFIGVIQAIVLPFVMTHGLGLPTKNSVRLYGYCLLLSTMFVSIQYLLIRVLANVGRFAGIILLMLQLTSSSGTYPVETSAKFFQNISRFLPMTYAVRILREIISGGNLSITVTSWTITVRMVILFMVLSFFSTYAFPKTRNLFRNHLLVFLERV
ncbi:YhgE/Pip domain-containing protein [Candidatus Roizmanbacteria bacterium]|nr:YhgE/Pip domain-containing protein [Candidatus Roizmanbacteria bacterium]